MAEETAVAESAPAEPALSEPQIPTNPEQYAKWRISGELPESKTPEPESAPEPKSRSKAVDAVKERATQEPEEAAESEPAEKQQERKPSPKETLRLQEILDDLRKAGLTPSELKTFKREVQQAEKQPPPKAAQEPTVKPAELKRPRLDDYNTLEEYETAREAYYEQRLEQKIEERRVKDVMEAQQRETQDKLRRAAEKYGEGSDTQIVKTAQAIWNDSRIAPAVKAVIGDSSCLADLMYVMGSQPTDFEEFLEEARTAPGKAIRRAVLVEHMVLDELGKSNGNGLPERSENGQFVKAPANKETKAPPPPRETGGRGSVPVDPAEQAWQNDDFRRYRAEMNRKDMARKKGM